MVEISHPVIRAYYDLYNQRRFREAGEFFADDAIVEHAPFGASPQRGPTAYVESAERSIHAFPDARIEVLSVTSVGDTIYEVDLVATGTHRGLLDLGSYGRFEATNVHVHVRHREVIEIRGGKITYASVTLDISELLAQLTGGRS
jgi:predicted ester cyclase